MSDAFFELLSRVHEQKQYALVKELHGERIGMGAESGVALSPAIPTGPSDVNRGSYQLAV